MILQLIYRPEPGGEMKPVALPLSKSIALRVMTLNAVSQAGGGRGALVPELPDAADVEGMERAMRLYEKQTRMLRAGEAIEGWIVNIGEGGAPLRFFTALAASTPGTDISVATSRGLMRRPLKPLLDALTEAGADVRSLRRAGYPPLRIRGRRLSAGNITLNPSVSSQFVSALMMTAPMWRSGLHLSFGGHKPVSAPYMAMTAEIMRRFGADVNVTDTGVEVAPRPLDAPAEFIVETDWSAASYFYELALLLPGVPIRFERLTPADGSLQGDARCADIFGMLGTETIYNSDGSATLCCDPERLALCRCGTDSLELDLNDAPDLVPALAVGFCLAGVRFRFTGIGHLRHKESDRMTALANELERIGYSLEIEEDAMSWTGRRTPTGENETILTYADHRMAMAFAPVAAVLPYVAIDSPDVVVKSFPGYWKALEGLGFELKRFGGVAHGHFSKRKH